MSTMSLEILAVHPRRALRWSQLTHSFAQWRQQARSRAELAMLNDRVLQDIGMSRYTVNFEASSRFGWPDHSRRRPLTHGLKVQR